MPSEVEGSAVMAKKYFYNDTPSLPLQRFNPSAKRPRYDRERCANHLACGGRLE